MSVFQAQKSSLKAESMLAPINGVNASENMAAMGATNCIYTFNLMPKNFGSTVRAGYREWANGVTGADGVRTMVTFLGLASNGAEDRLFACTSEGIFDVTIDGTTSPIQVVTWPVQDPFAGLVIFTQYTTAAGAFLLLTDGANGYYTFEGSTNTWTEETLTGPGDARDLAFVTVWKNRVWFVEKNSGSAWYLPVGSFTGTATEFEFGNKFRYGGQLVGLWNWTLDGGNGIDDYLVVISEAGDLIVYQGTDPAQAAEFGEVGAWFIGAMPFGRRVASDFGGDLMVLSSYGLVSMNDLLKGSTIGGDERYMTTPIAPYIREVMSDSRELQGWEINADPEEGIVIIDTPTRAGKAPIQFVMNMGTKAWGFWRDVPLSTMVPWRGGFYFGSQDQNSIWKFSGSVDHARLDPDVDGPATTINWSMLSSYSSLGAPASNKLLQFMRPVFSSDAEPAFEIVPRFDFDVREGSTNPIATTGVAGRWDIDSWENAVWGGGDVSQDNPTGVSGMGRYVAYALKGSSSVRTTLVAVDVLYTEAGLL